MGQQTQWQQTQWQQQHVAWKTHTSICLCHSTTLLCHSVTLCPSLFFNSLLCLPPRFSPSLLPRYTSTQQLKKGGRQQLLVLCHKTHRWTEEEIRGKGYVSLIVTRGYVSLYAGFWQQQREDVMWRSEQNDEVCVGGGCVGWTDPQNTDVRRLPFISSTKSIVIVGRSWPFNNPNSAYYWNHNAEHKLNLTSWLLCKLNHCNLWLREHGAAAETVAQVGKKFWATCNTCHLNICPYSWTSESFSWISTQTPTCSLSQGSHPILLWCSTFIKCFWLLVVMKMSQK